MQPGPEEAAAEAPRGDLSGREREILVLVATGASNKQIAQALDISPNTVKVHLRNIFGKVGAASRTEAAMYALRAGLVEMPGGESARADGAAAAVPRDEQAALAAATARPRPRFEWAAPWLAAALVVAVVALAAVVGLRDLASDGATAEAPTAAAATPQPRWFVRTQMSTARSRLAVAAFEGEAYAIGGETAAGITGAVERFDLATDTWTSLAPKPLPVADASAAAIGGLIYVPGGRTASDKPTVTVEAYDPRQDAWHTKAALPQPLSGYALAAFEGRLYLFGGWDGASYVNTVYIYEPETDAWTTGTPMPTARALAGAGVAAGRIYVVGGTDGNQALTVNEAYAPSNEAAGADPWETRASLPQPRYAMGLASVVDLLHVVGGEPAGSALPPLEYAPGADQWRPFDAPGPADWSNLGLTVVETYLVAVGGVQAAAPVADTRIYKAVYTIVIPVIEE